MNPSVLALLAVLSAASAAPSPLDLGPGGVYDGQAAQGYWAQRFGAGFFASLAGLQRGPARPAAAVAPEAVRAGKRRKVVKVVKRPRKTTTTTTTTTEVPVYIETAAPPTAMSALQVESFDAAPGLDYAYYDDQVANDVGL